MWLLVILTGLVYCCGLDLKEHETGRFVYKLNNGDLRYCTTCKTGWNNIENERTQQEECIKKNFRVPMPDNSTNIPICQEHITGAVIPGCGPLPRTGGLSWKTLSGRPVLKNSTVYEEYFPRCPPGSTLNHNSSVRCGENLKWNVNPEELQCKTNECDHWYCSEEVKIGACSLAVIIVVALLWIVLYNCRTFLTKNPPTEPSRDEVSPMLDSPSPTGSSIIITPPVVKKPMEHDLPIGENVITPSVSLGTLPSIKSFDEISTMPYKHFDTCINQIKRRPMKNTDLSRDNIRVFPILHVTNEGLLDFVVQKGKQVFIATKETLRESECLQISRKGGSYMGHQVHPFMHCIDKVEPQDSGLYHWRTSSTPKTEHDHLFYLTVEDRGQPDGGYSPTSNGQVTTCSVTCGEVLSDHIEYHSSASFPCMDPSSLCLYQSAGYLSCMQWLQRAHPDHCPAQLNLDDSCEEHCSFCFQMHHTRPKDIYTT
uniref:Uncharacterized protein LOC111126223 isoform X2 n=1 Tax=Crassostrea virginica TaxID=6565 RepID=A0A8B8DE57_CRAVI|nr:uncharacterized protein LOC111126223 isoform X2 [Crassostrea virginica]